MDQEEWTAAVRDLEELENLLPDNVLGPLNLAVCHFSAGSIAKARAAAQRARALAPDNPVLLYALARIYREGGEINAWQDVLDTYVEAHRRDPRSHYLLWQGLYDDGRFAEAHQAIETAVRVSPENLVLLVGRLTSAARAGLLAETRAALDGVEDRLGGFDGSAAQYADEIRQAIRDGEADATGATERLAPRALVVENILRPSGLYRQHLIPLVGGGDNRLGLFTQLDFEPALPKSIQGGQDIALDFVAVESPELAGLAGHVLVLSDETRDRLLAESGAGLKLLEVGKNGWIELAPPSLAAFDRVWDRRDFDQDGEADWLLQHEFTLQLQTGQKDDPVDVAVLEAKPTAVFPVDLDQEGDLDLIVSLPGRTLYLQNSGSASWIAKPGYLGQLEQAEVLDLEVADFDDDGDLDLVAAVSGQGVRLLLNQLPSTLTEASQPWGLEAESSGASRLAVEDFDGDGRFDLLTWGDSLPRVYTNHGESFGSPETVAQEPWRTATVGDFDNDGDRDVLAAEVTGELTLLRNLRGSFRAEPGSVGNGGQGNQDAKVLSSGDFDGDGDLDVVASGPDGLRSWRNDGGSLNQWLRVRLRGKDENNSKNNSEGMFVRIEGRVGDHFQMLSGSGGYNHVGLGAARQLDVLRVVWTNGLSQTWAALAANQTLDEEQVLKGSCPFLYTWNGESFEFVTDLMWKSPLGMAFADGSAAPHQPASDFVRIPARALSPRGGELWLQVTEELWETAYVDLQSLLVVDHPSGQELLLDEQLTLPPHPSEPPISWGAARFEPVRATDHSGRDVLPAVRSVDGVYLDGLPLDRYQGLTRGHSLELEFEHDSTGSEGPLYLALHGWIFPTDSSINFALAQDAGRAPYPPRLELWDSGRWTVLAQGVGIPAGKRKSVVIGLPGDLPAGNLRLRLSTNMQIYWDAAALVRAAPTADFRVTRLRPSTAELHYRGFSRTVRASNSSPHLFDYRQVSTAPVFADLAGYYTRFGEVTDLLLENDDRYVVLNAGDEMTVRYPAELPPLPEGWSREYVLYTDGWVKDGDNHTTASRTVEPLPFHGMPGYTEASSGAADRPDLNAYFAEYQTRWVDAEPFRRTLVAPDER